MVFRKKEFERGNALELKTRNTEFLRTIMLSNGRFILQMKSCLYWVEWVFEFSTLSKITIKSSVKAKYIFIGKNEWANTFLVIFTTIGRAHWFNALFTLWLCEVITFQSDIWLNWKLKYKVKPLQARSSLAIDYFLLLFVILLFPMLSREFGSSLLK